MPLSQLFHTPTGGSLHLWKVTENRDQLFDSLRMTPKAEDEWREISHPKRKQEWLAARHLFHNLGIAEIVRYMDNGKPYLLDGRKISISHSKDLVGVFIHPDKEVGIDIQSPDEKLVKISSRFCNAEEFDFAANSANPIEVFTVIWSAKEAVFKVYGENIHFARQMSVRPFKLDDQRISLDFNSDSRGNRTFELTKFRIGEYYLIIAEA